MKRNFWNQCCKNCKKNRKPQSLNQKKNAFLGFTKGTSLKRGDEVVDTEGVRGVVLGFEKGGWVVTVAYFDRKEANISCCGVPACCIKEIIPA